MMHSDYPLIPTHSRRKNSWTRKSPLNSGWKLVTSFFPCFIATILMASTSAGPSGESAISGMWGTRSRGKTQRFSVWLVDVEEEADSSGVPVRDETKEWMAGARMKMAGKGTSGFNNPSKGMLASKLSFWAARTIARRR
jgi:hypothetical protein